MLTMKDLIDAKVAPANYTDVYDQRNDDRMSINYNNIWGVVTDTNMRRCNDECEYSYIITGQLMRDEQKVRDLLFNPRWGTRWGVYRFADSSIGVDTLFNYITMNHFTAEHCKVNGDDVIVLKPMSDEQIAHLYNDKKAEEEQQPLFKPFKY